MFGFQCTFSVTNTTQAVIQSTTYSMPKKGLSPPFLFQLCAYAYCGLFPWSNYRMSLSCLGQRFIQNVYSFSSSIGHWDKLVARLTYCTIVQSHSGHVEIAFIAHMYFLKCLFCSLNAAGPLNVKAGYRSKWTHHLHCSKYSIKIQILQYLLLSEA